LGTSAGGFTRVFTFVRGCAPTELDKESTFCRELPVTVSCFLIFVLPGKDGYFNSGLQSFEAGVESSLVGI